MMSSNGFFALDLLHSIISFQSAGRKLYSYLKVAPYASEHAEEDEDYDASQGLRIMGITCSQYKWVDKKTDNINAGD